MKRRSASPSRHLIFGFGRKHEKGQRDEETQKRIGDNAAFFLGGGAGGVVAERGTDLPPWPFPMAPPRRNRAKEHDARDPLHRLICVRSSELIVLQSSLW